MLRLERNTVFILISANGTPKVYKLLYFHTKKETTAGKFTISSK